MRPVVFIKPICLPRTPHYMPLWMRQVEYPKFTPGDPQLRCFLPPFWMKMLYPGRHNPLDNVVFKVHPQMTVYDVRQYLEKIYNVPVMSVRLKKAYHDLSPIDTPAMERVARSVNPFNLPPSPERYEKLAYVRLAPGTEFQFPDIFKEERPSDLLDKFVNKESKAVESEKSSDVEESESVQKKSVDNAPQTAATSGKVNNWFS